jgi:hypothetical protein
MRIDDAGVALVRLIDDRRRGCATKVCGGFETHRLERTTDDAGGDWVNGRPGWQRRTTGRKLAIEFERHGYTPDAIRPNTTWRIQASSRGAQCTSARGKAARPTGQQMRTASRLRSRRSVEFTIGDRC